MRVARAQLVRRLGFTEHQMQTALVSLLVGAPRAGLDRTPGHGLTGRYPELSLLYAIPNQRMGAIAGGRMKAEGQLRGMPDLCLPVARGGYHSLYLETKLFGQPVPDHQRAIHEALRAEGHAVVVWREIDVVVQVVRAYMGLPTSALDFERMHLTLRD